MNLSSINRVTTVMPKPVFDERDEPSGVSAEFRLGLINEIADQLDDTDIGPFVVATDVVRIAVCASGDDLPEGFAVVGYIEPISHIHAVAINRNGLAIQDLLYDDRDQFLGELERTVVVRAISNDYR